MPAIASTTAPQPYIAAPADATQCPVDDWQRHHREVKADAATGAPVTPHGQRLLETARQAPRGQLFGECLCGSSFLFTVQPRSAK